MAELLYNSHSQSVCLDEVSIARTSIQHPATKAVIGHRETWTISAVLIGDTASLLTQVAALELAYSSDNHSIYLKTAAGGTILHQMITGSTADGVKITQRPSFPTLKNAEFVTKRSYTIVAEAELYDGDPALLLDDQKWSYQIGQDGKCTRTLSGRLETASGQSAASYFAARAPSLTGGYTRGPRSHEQNHDDTEMSYSYTDIEYWQALPAGVLEGGYTTSATRTGDTWTVTIAGRFTGPTVSVDAAITALRRPSLRLQSENIVTEPFAGAKSFTLVYEYATSDLYEWQETVSITRALARQIFHEVLGGEYPVRQVGSMTTARASVSGRAIGVTTYPAFPATLWPEENLVPGGCVETSDGPKKTADGKYQGYGISWRHEFEFSMAVTTRLPRVR